MISRFGAGAAAAALVGCAIVGGAAIRTDTRPTTRLAVPVSDERRPDDHVLPGSGGWPYDPRTIADWGLADDFDIDIEVVHRVTGKGTIDTLLDNNADVAFVAATPIITAVANGDDVLVLAQTERSDRQMRLVARSDHVGDWFDQPIGIVPGTAFESALTAEIERAGRIASLRDGSIDLIGAQDPFAVLNSLVDGTVSSALLPQPQAAMLTTQQGDGSAPTYVDITTPHLLHFDGFLVTTARRWEDNREAILRTLAVAKATRTLVAQNPAQRLRTIHNYEAGDSSLRDSPPWFWSADELVFITDRTELQDALTHDASLQVLSGKIAALPDFTDALGVVDEVSRRVETEVVKLR